MSRNFDAPLMYREVGTKAFCGSISFEGKKLLNDYVGAKGLRGTKGHVCMSLSVLKCALQRKHKVEFEKRTMDCAMRWFESSLQAIKPLKTQPIWDCTLPKMGHHHYAPR